MHHSGHGPDVPCVSVALRLTRAAAPTGHRDPAPEDPPVHEPAKHDPPVTPPDPRDPPKTPPQGDPPKPSGPPEIVD